MPSLARAVAGVAGVSCCGAIPAPTNSQCRNTIHTGTQPQAPSHSHTHNTFDTHTQTSRYGLQHQQQLAAAHHAQRYAPSSCTRSRTRRRGQASASAIPASRTRLANTRRAVVTSRAWNLSTEGEFRTPRHGAVEMRAIVPILHYLRALRPSRAVEGRVTASNSGSRARPGFTDIASVCTTHGDDETTRRHTQPNKYQRDTHPASHSPWHAAEAAPAAAHRPAAHTLCVDVTLPASQ